MDRSTGGSRIAGRAAPCSSTSMTPPAGCCICSLSRVRALSIILRRLAPIPLAVTLGPCTYCGFCEWFGCSNYSKASPQTTVLPALIRQPNFEARTQCEVLKINLDGSGKRATGVTYVDTSGNEWEQPADLVLLCAFQLFNVHLLLISGIGKPYDPRANEGVIGRNYSYQVTSSVDAFFDNKIFNPFIASGSIGMCIDEFNGDNFDHGPHGFVGGGYLGAVQTNGRPLQTTRTPKG